MSLSISKVTKFTSKIVPSDVRSTTTKLTGAMRSGYRIGKRCNSMHKRNLFQSTTTSAKSVTKELRKLKFTKEEMPALIASITSLVPIPPPVPITPIVYGIGKIIAKIVK